MHLVEVPLNRFLYRFRRLNWVEESQIEFAKTEDQRLTILAHALHDVSDLPIASLEAAKKVLRAIPSPVRSRLWVIYRGSLPEDRKFTHLGDLFDAPDHQVYNKTLADAEPDDPDAEDAVTANLVRQFGPAAAREAADLQQLIVRQAQKEGKLVRANPQEGVPHA